MVIFQEMKLHQSAPVSSHHLVRRCQQRGVSETAVQAIIEFGRREHCQGAISCSMDQRAMSQARREIPEPVYRRIERHLQACYVMLSPDLSCIMTVAYRLKRRRR